VSIKSCKTCKFRSGGRQVRSPRSTRNARRFRFLRSSDLQSQPWCPVRSTSVRDKQWARFEQYCVRKASQAGRSSRVREAWHRRRQSRKGFTARGPLDPPSPQWTGHPPRASNDLVEKYLGPKNPEFQGSDRHPIASHRAALSPALLRSMYPPLRLPRDHGLRDAVGD
jgi:hypothetical protein